MPVFDGMLSKSFAYASKPPAEAPTATTEDRRDRSTCVACADKGDLPECERADLGLAGRDLAILCFALVYTEECPNEDILAVPAGFRLALLDLRRGENRSWPHAMEGDIIPKTVRLDPHRTSPKDLLITDKERGKRDLFDGIRFGPGVTQ